MSVDFKDEGKWNILDENRRVREEVQHPYKTLVYSQVVFFQKDFVFPQNAQSSRHALSKTSHALRMLFLLRSVISSSYRSSLCPVFKYLGTEELV